MFQKHKQKPENENASKKVECLPMKAIRLALACNFKGGKSWQQIPSPCLRPRWRRSRLVSFILALHPASSSFLQPLCVFSTIITKGLSQNVLVLARLTRVALSTAADTGFGITVTTARALNLLVVASLDGNNLTGGLIGDSGVVASMVRIVPQLPRAVCRLNGERGNCTANTNEGDEESAGGVRTRCGSGIA